MSAQHAKRGRKAKHYTMSDGTPVPGLSRRPDGRWRVIATGKEFTCADERLAVHLFNTRYRPDVADTVAIPVLKAGPATSINQVQQILFPHVQTDDTGTSYRQADPALVWGWFRQQLLSDPIHVANMTGIPQLARLIKEAVPADSPTLKQVWQLYSDKATITGHWRVKCELFWEEFGQAVGVQTLRELTQEHFIQYRDSVLEDADSPTYAKHRFGAIKTLLRFPKKHGKWALDCDQALAFAAVLVPPESVAMNPKPISRADYHKLLEAAKGDDTMTAILLMALNACMYGKEVADVRWSHLDLQAGTLIMRREKTRVARIAVLWPRTVAALAKLAQGGEHPFLTAATRQPHNANTIRKAFVQSRAAAALPEVEFNQIRDGAYTYAIQGTGVQLQHVQAMAGHRTGIADHYLLRNPKLVADACRAVEAAYFS